MPGARRPRRHITRLTRPDQEALNQRFDAALAARPIQDDRVGSDVYAELKTSAASSAMTEAAQADRILKTLAIERLDTWGKDRARETGTLVNIGGKKTFVSDARSSRVRIYTTNGTVIAWQSEFWWGVDWDQLAAMIQDTMAQGAVLGDKLAAMRRGYALKDRFPGATNVQEACALMSITVEQFMASAP